MPETTLVTKKTILFILGVVLICLSVFLPVYFTIIKDDSVFIPTVCSSAFICIDSDDDFAYYNLAGNGSYSNPYVIENLTMIRDFSCGVLIKNTTKHFVIRNCFFDSSSGIEISKIQAGTAKIHSNEFWGKTGISLMYAKNTLITNNSFTQFSIGIGIALSEETIISNNTMQNSLEYNWEKGNIGFAIYGSSDNISISNNSFINCVFGMYIVAAKNNNIISNFFLENNRGLHLENSVNPNIINNRFTNNSIGLDLYENSDEVIINNTFIHDGISLSSEPEVFINNTVNGKNLGVFSDQNNLKINQPVYGQLFFYRCQNLSIENQILSNTYNGIYLESCPGARMINNTCNQNAFYGIGITKSGNSQFINNTCSENYIGIRLYFSSNSVSFFNNTLVFNSVGLYLGDVINHIFVSGNNISFNIGEGIKLEGYQSSNISIQYNLFLGNGGFGLKIYQADNCTIHHNSFYYNAIEEESQASDRFGKNNLWYDISSYEGNYWSDWNGVGPYSIQGDANSYDNYPLENPPVIRLNSIA